MKFQLWSIQEESKLKEIFSTGKLICTVNKHSKEWDNEYKWMIKQMEHRIGKSSLKSQYPIWAWYQYQNSEKKKPDLRTSGFLPKGTKGIRIEFSKEESDVVLSDFELWHYPLSFKSIIPKNEKHNLQFEKRLKNLKLEKSKFEEMPENIKEEIEMSWQRIFDLDYEFQDFSQIRNEKMIQACCWEINESEIICIDKFKAR